MYRQPNTPLQNSIPKLSRQNPKSISRLAIYHGILARTSSRYQVFEKLLWKTKRRCLSKVNLESNITPNISRSTDSFSTVASMVNGDGWGCIVHDLETIIVLIFLAFNFIPQRSHYTFTLARARFRDCATVTGTPLDVTTAIKVGSSA